MTDTIERTRTRENVGFLANPAALGPSKPVRDVPLSINQNRALDEIVLQLDGNAPRKTLALYGVRAAGKSSLVRELFDSSRQRRTTLHRRVAGVVVDATEMDPNVTPWQHMLFAVLNRLTSIGQPTPPVVIADLRAELRDLAKLEAKNEKSATLAAAAFAHHFRAAWPGLLLNVITQQNSTFVVALDHLEHVRPDQAAQLLEASKYFLNAPGCTILLVADEPALSATLDGVDESVDGRASLQGWAAARIELRPSPFVKREAAVSMLQTSSSIVAPRTNAPADVPNGVVKLLSLMLPVSQVDAAIDQWRNSMRAVLKRTESGNRSNISAELIAKIIALRNLSKDLFNAARFDAALLVGLERRLAHPGASSELGNEFDAMINNEPRLRSLFKAQPLFSIVELRDLAAALRLASSDDSKIISLPEAPATAPITRPTAAASASPRTASAAPVMDEPEYVDRAGLSGRMQRIRLPESLPSLDGAAGALSNVLSALPRLNLNLNLNKNLTGLIAPGVIVATSALGVFVLDRLPKLILKPGSPALGGLLKVASVSTSTASAMNSGLSIGLELMGIVMSVLILVFWGAGRGMKYTLGLGLVIGSLTANLLDRMAYGAVFNYINIGQLPVFNLAHLGLLAGAIMLSLAILGRSEGASAPARIPAVN